MPDRPSSQAPAARLIAALRDPRARRFGVGARAHRAEHWARIEDACYAAYEAQGGFLPALERLFRRIDERVGAAAPTGPQAWRRARGYIPSLIQCELGAWPLPWRGAHDVWASWQEWRRQERRAPRLRRGSRWWQGLPEHEGKPGATLREAQAAGYYGRFPRAYLDWEQYTICGQRLALRTRGHRWAEIAVMTGDTVSARTIRRQIAPLLVALGIRAPQLRRGRPEL